MTGSRFNPERLVKLASTLINRFSSDYYAFQGIESLKEGNFMENFYSLLKKCLKEWNKPQIPIPQAYI